MRRNDPPHPVLPMTDVFIFSISSESCIMNPSKSTILNTNMCMYFCLLPVPVVLSSEESLKRVRALTGCAQERLVFHKVDICDAVALRAVLELSLIHI